MSIRYISRLAPRAPHLAPLGRWLALLPDHVLPGTLFTLVAAAYVMTLAEYWRGEGAASGLDAVAHAWLVIQRAAAAAFYSLIAVLFIFRRPRVGPRAGLVPAAVALGGSFAFSLQAWAPVTAPHPILTIPGSVLVVSGTVLALVSLAYLGRCFGVFPEARGLVTRGPYAYVRHPMYLAEITGALGGGLPTLSAYTALIFALFVALQYCRAVYEERALRAVFPEYADYARCTWRIVPGIH